MFYLLAALLTPVWRRCARCATAIAAAVGRAATLFLAASILVGCARGWLIGLVLTSASVAGQLRWADRPAYTQVIGRRMALFTLTPWLPWWRRSARLLRMVLRRPSPPVRPLADGQRHVCDTRCVRRRCGVATGTARVVNDIMRQVRRIYTTEALFIACRTVLCAGQRFGAAAGQQLVIKAQAESAFDSVT
jgi:hypothetical protein